MTGALVIGKFYPPHLGHVHLLRTALRTHERVVVLCLGSAQESFSPEQRLNALLRDSQAAGLETSRIIGRWGFDESPFDLQDEAVWSSHVDIFNAHRFPFAEVDTLMTSESYGEELARRMGLNHMSCDPQRVEAPFSASAIRSDPTRYWNDLGPGTRAMLASRIVIIGAESTGTSTVARTLAERIRSRGRPWDSTQLVEEYGRELTIRKQQQEAQAVGSTPLSVSWNADDFAEVARTQAAREEHAAAIGSPVLICDTDAFATPVWERRYLGEDARLDAGSLGRGDVYLLTSHEHVPFVQDGTRDGEHVRSAMTAEFAQELIAHGRPWAMLTGSLEQRVSLAQRIADRVVGDKLSFQSPP